MKTRLRKKEIRITLDKISSITRHIKNVQDNCILLATKLITNGEIELGRKLVQHGFQHDVSKFGGIEWENMAPGTSVDEATAKLKLKMAINHHQKTNPHHVEYWVCGIKGMSDEYLAELCCDIKARSEEFGTAVRDYINNTAIKKWNITPDDIVYKKIMKFLDMLCETPFQDLKKD